MRAVVVFSDGDQAGAWWHPFLAPGFRHVECFIEPWPGRWVGVAGGCGDLFVLPMPDGFDPPAFAAANGLAAVEALAQPANGRWWLLARRDCVAFAKLLLGVHGWRVMTPRQLFRRLVRDDVARLMARCTDPSLKPLAERFPELATPAE